ncbi:MAG TPA: hypothetical protein VHD90_00180 [Phototrophicaceae bacterium]|nr:hypothetical protein [Phototrophicaceae bacterium]
MDVFIASLLSLINETLAAAIVVVAASILLYNLSRNLRDRVARTSAVLLGCVTAAYVCIVLLTLGPGLGTYIDILRLQWLGIAFMPAAMFHLSDALLATTGLPSRGRRRRVIRILYLVSAAFLLAAAFSNLLVEPQIISAVDQDFAATLRAGPLFPVYVIFFLIATGVAFVNVQRARSRCLTRSTRRRMGYLQVAMLTPAVGLFPFSVLIGPTQESSLLGLFLVSLTSVVVIFMLLFLAYPLSFFGSRIPDRVVKTELLRFVLRGPATALLALVAILFITPTTRVLGLPGQSFMPFAVVAVVLFWQWSVALALPYLERRLVYNGEEADQLEKLGSLSERLLARGDLLQLLEAILASACDYLRVNSAFVASLKDATPEVVSFVGSIRPTAALLQEERDNLDKLFDHPDNGLHLETWHTYWIMPLYGRHSPSEGDGHSTPMGFMGIQARSGEIDLTPDELHMLETFAHRAAQTLDDLALQSDIFAALEGLLPQIAITRTSSADLEFRPRREVSQVAPPSEESEQFREQVRAALKHLWGGPGLTNSALLDLKIVNAALPDNDNNPPRALRAMLIKAIEKQKPDGERKLLSPEWTLYNILELRFLQKTKVSDVAQRLALSEPDLYRKQRVAIDAVADTLWVMENGNGNGHSAHPPAE